MSDFSHGDKIKNYDIFDLTKLILSFFIVAIHTALFPEVLYPWLRTAVPLFFIISSYLLFSRLNGMPAAEQKKSVGKYISRQLKLYCFWFILVLPVTAYNVVARLGWFSDGAGMGIVNIVRNTLFSGTFTASWFITAGIEGTLLIFWLSKKLPVKVLVLLTTAVYLLCCLRSSYWFLVEGIKPITAIDTVYEAVFTNPALSFPVASFWIMMGKLFAEGQVRFNRKLYIVTAVLSACLLYAEWRIVWMASDLYNNDCYVFLAPLAFSLFGLLKEVRISVPNGLRMRRMSTITYTMHGSAAVIVAAIINRVLPWEGMVHPVTFLCTVGCCHVAAVLILKLKDKRHLRFLKYAY